MHRQRRVWGLVAIIIGMWACSPLPAQEPTAERSKRVPLIDQIDDLGRTIFDGILSPFQQGSNRERTAESPARSPRYANRSSLVRGHSDEIREPNRIAVESPADQPAAEPPVVDAARRKNLWDELVGKPVTSADSSPSPYANAYPPEVTPTTPTRQEPVASARDIAQAAEKTAKPEQLQQPDQSEPPQTADPTSRRLYERLTALRKSAFEDFPEPEAGAPTAVAESGPATSQPKTSETATNHQPVSQPGKSVESAVRQPMVKVDKPAAAKPTIARSAPQEPDARKPSEIIAPVAEPVADSTAESEPAVRQPVPSATSDSLVDKRVEKVAPPTRAPESKPEPELVPVDRAGRVAVEDDVLTKRQSPVLDVRTLGPRRITLGKPSSFVVSIDNTGLVAADQTVVTIGLPEWADVISTESTTGTAGWANSMGVVREFQWQLGRLEAKGHEELVLKVVPLKSQPFDLAVKWDYRPVAAQTLIEVQEPKVEISLTGPRKILYGAREVYRLELANTGTGDAENVVISLMPIGVGSNVPATHTVGLLPAGDKKAVEVELTARQSGELTVEVEAHGDAGVAAKLVERIVVVRPALRVDIERPSGAILRRRRGLPDSRH